MSPSKIYKNIDLSFGTRQDKSNFCCINKNIYFMNICLQATKYKI